MKIYRFTDHSGHSRTGNSDALAAYHAARRGSAPVQTGGSDVVEISEEARNRYERARIISLQEAQTQKLAAEYKPLIQKKIEAEGDVPSQINHRMQVYDIRESVRNGEYDFAGTDILDETADSLFAFLLAG